MPTVVQSGEVTPIPNIADALFATDARNTIVTSRMRKGERLDAMTHTYKVKREGVRKSGGVPDNKPVTEHEGHDPEHEVLTRMEVFQRAPRVGFIAKHTNVAGTVVVTKPGKTKGTSTKMAKARADQLKNIKHDAESEVLGDQESRPESGPNGSKFRGLGVWLQTTAQADQPIPEEVRTPTGQIYAGTVANFNEDANNTLLQKRWEACGMSSELVGIGGSRIKTQINSFTIYQPQKAGHDSIVRTMNNEVKTLVRGVDILEGDYGTVELHLGFFLPTTARGYYLDFDQIEMLPFGPFMEEEPLANDGGGEARVLRSMFAYHVGDPRAHCKIKPSDE